MTTAFFFVEYKDGDTTKIKFKTDTAARKAFKLYELEPESDAKSWGWYIDADKTKSNVLYEQHTFSKDVLK